MLVKGVIVLNETITTRINEVNRQILLECIKNPLNIISEKCYLYSVSPMFNPRYLVMKWKCNFCGFEEGLLENYYWKCPRCGRPLSVEYTVRGGFHSSRNMWQRYSGLIPFTPEKTRGEGLTPLVVEKSSQHVLLFKLEYLNPGGSFKDRGSALAVYYGYKMGFKKAVVDTSGNTGISVTLYSKLYGLESVVIMPKTAPAGKKRAVLKIGGKLIESEDRLAAYRAVDEYVKKGDVYYVAHLWNPLYIIGHATIAYEVFEEYGVPDYVIVPVGSGGLFLALEYGFEKLIEQGLTTKKPRLIAVQGYSCQPLHEVLHGERVSGEDSSLADGIIVPNPPRLNEVAEKIKSNHGEVVLVGNSEIQAAVEELWQTGFLVEPTSATVYAAYKKTKEKIPSSATILLVLTGSGLKTL